jgi:hypothetical protein
LSTQPSDGSNSYFLFSYTAYQRVPWYLDVRLIAPAVVTSLLVALLTLLSWPVENILQRRRRTAQSEAITLMYLGSRLVLIADIAVVAILAALKLYDDASIFPEALDPVIIVMYVLAWIGAFGALSTVWVAVEFWRNRIGGRWSRIHQMLIAASAVVLGWCFIAFHVAGTTLNY